MTRRSTQPPFEEAQTSVVEVGIGEVRFASAPARLVTPALGSCVGVSIFDPFAKRGAMAHVMLPSIGAGAALSSPGRFADYAIPLMVTTLREQGSLLARLEAKIAGGAAMFSGESRISGIGERNIIAVKRQLELMEIPLIAEDTGEAYARTVELCLATGEVTVRSYKSGVRCL